MVDNLSARIDQLSLKTVRTEGNTLGRQLCDLCDMEPVTIDKEWMGPGKWEKTLRCPDCDRETTIDVSVSYSLPRDVSISYEESFAEAIKKAYVMGNMSEEALENSLERAFQLSDN